MDCLHQFGTYLVTPKMVEILCYRRSDSFFDFHLNPLAEVFSPQRSAVSVCLRQNPNQVLRTGKLKQATMRCLP